MKVNEFIIKKADRNVREFIDEATLIFNFGKYSAQIVKTPPQWVARNGEFAFFQSSTSSGNRVYFYANDQWNWMSGSPTGGAGVVGSEGDVQINSSNAFGAVANTGFNYSIANNRFTVRTSVLINTTSGSWLDDGDPALYVVGRADSSGTTHFLVRNSSNSLTLFEVQNNRIILGNNRGFSVNDAPMTAYVDGDPSVFVVAGEQTKSAPSSIQFQDRANSITHNYRNVGQFFLNTGVPDLAASTIAGTGGFIAFDAANLTNLSRETPMFHFDACTRTIVDSLTNQRFLYISSGVVSGAGTLKSVSNCATVYIQGPSLASNNSTNLQNNYSIWIDQGISRFDGDVVVYGNLFANVNSINVPSNIILFTSNTNQIITNTDGAVTLFSSGVGLLTLPANYLSHGKILRITGRGVYSTTVTPGSANFTILLGGSSLASKATTAFLNSASNSGFEFIQDILCETSGSTGKISTVGNVNYVGLLGANTARIFDDIDNDGAPTTLDTTTALTISFTSAWDTADASKILNVVLSSVESLN